MKFKAIVQSAEEGGYWAYVPAIPGCATQGETMEELLANLQEAIIGCLEASPTDAEMEQGSEVVEILIPA